MERKNDVGTTHDGQYMRRTTASGAMLTAVTKLLGLTERPLRVRIVCKLDELVTISVWPKDNGQLTRHFLRDANGNLRIGYEMQPLADALGVYAFSDCTIDLSDDRRDEFTVNCPIMNTQSKAVLHALFPMASDGDITDDLDVVRDFPPVPAGATFCIKPDDPCNAQSANLR